MSARLTALDGKKRGKTYPITGELMIGRHPQVDLRIDDPTVSRRHAKVFQKNGAYFIEDQNSGNGTYVNERRIQCVELKNGDRIRISRKVFLFEMEDSKPAVVPDLESTLQFVDEDDWGSSVVGELDVSSKSLARASEKDSLPKLRKRLEAIHAISAAVATDLDTDRLLKKIIGQLTEALPQADHVFILLLDEKTGEMKARAGFCSKVEDRRVVVSKTVLSRVVRRKQSLLIEDVVGDGDFRAASSIMNAQMRSIVCAPLIAGDKVVGAIHVDTTKPGAFFTVDDLDLLTTVALEAAMAVERAEAHRRELKQQRIQRDLQIARQIQKSFVPDKAPVIDGYAFSFTYRSAMEVGGDFFDFIEIPGDRIGVAIGDVSGKGIPAALMMARASSLLRSFAVTEQEPAKVLTEVNQRICASNVEGIFITMIYMLVDLPSGEIRLCNCAHPWPILVAGETGECTEIEVGGNLPVGVADDYVFQEGEARLERGDRIVMYTDGVSEAMNAKKEMLGKEKILEALRGANESPDDLVQRLLRTVSAFVGDTPQSDDLTLVCVGRGAPDQWAVREETTQERIPMP